MNASQIADKDIDRVTAVVQTYFAGLHHANIEDLSEIFHPDTVLKAPGLRRTLTEWLTLVSQREVPAQLGHADEYKILSIDIVGEQAMVKVLCPLLGRRYIDFLGLLKEKQKWLIVNKMYADI